MNESKHTQGTWEIKDVGYPKDKEFWICLGQDVIAKVSNTKIEEQADANARLIAAAPALLEACKAQHEAIDRLFAVLISNLPMYLPSESGQPWDALKQGNTAIALTKKGE